MYPRLLVIAARTFLPIGMFLLLVSWFGANEAIRPWVSGGAGLTTMYLVLLLSVVFGVLPQRGLVSRLSAFVEGGTTKFEAWAEGVPTPRAPIVIIALSFCSLFLELALIRWQAGLFSVFAFYKNFTLLACFCGLGIGYAMADRKPILFPLCLPALALNIVVMLVLHYGGNDFTHLMFGLVPVYEEGTVDGVAGATRGGGLLAGIFANLPVYFLLVNAFLLNALVMIPMSQLCGRLMRRVPPLASYGFNLVGSICGVTALFALSWVWIGPIVWFGLVAILLLWYLFAAGQGWRAGLISMTLLLVTLSWPTEPLIQNIYSPYQLIQKAAEPSGLMRILAAGTYYQKVFDLSFEHVNRDPDSKLQKIIGYYELPFLTAKTRENVAIVGAGSGNDVAAALRYHAVSVDAAEIDPVIWSLGRMFHPEHPYQDPRVRPYIGDARAFFRNVRRSYDVIVYGVLDSHILVSGGSNVRVDSFVYTQEGLADAFRQLKPGGLMSVSFALTNELMGRKVYTMLRHLPGAGMPVAVLTSYDTKSTTTFMVRRSGEVDLPVEFLRTHQLTDQTERYVRSTDATNLDLPTDNWPFFYMDYKMYPASYVVSLVLVMVLAVTLMRCLLPGSGWTPGMIPFLFLGAGFMLVETKAITELGLLFGNTWWVVGITIMSVLLMGFAANVAVMRWRLRSVVLPYTLLLGMISIGFGIARSGGLQMDGVWGKVVLTLLLLVTPLAFFEGLCSRCCSNGKKMCRAHWLRNLSGAMLGGLLEYNAMEFGFSALYLIALVLYACAWLATRKVAQTI